MRGAALRRLALLLLPAAPAATTCINGSDVSLAPRLPKKLKARPLRTVGSDCPKTYVYDIPALWDYDVPWRELHTVSPARIFGQPCGAGVADEFDTAQWSMAMVVLWRLATSARCGAVDEPRDAELFLVPTWPAAKDADAWDAVCDREANENETKALPHLDEARAHRHVLLVGKGHTKPRGKCDRWWRKPRGLLKRATRFAYSDDYRRRQAPTAPSSSTTPSPGRWPATASSTTRATSHLYSVPYPSNVHGLSRAAWRFRPPAWRYDGRRRESLVSYLGTTHANKTYAGLRPRLKAACDLRQGLGAADRCERTSPRDDRDACAPKVKNFCGLKATMMRATFCLEPGGDSPYRKGVFDALLSGCVPVLFSQQLARRAWHRGLEALAGVARGDLDALAHLAGLDGDAVAELRSNAAATAPALQYAVDDAAGPGDAFEIILRAAVAGRAPTQIPIMAPAKKAAAAKQSTTMKDFFAPKPKKQKPASAAASTPAAAKADDATATDATAKAKILANKKEAQKKRALKFLEPIADDEWRRFAGEASKSYLFALAEFVAKERRAKTVFPPPEHTFAALDACPLSGIKVVVVGQDPYHGPGQAHGLAFSIKDGADCNHQKKGWETFTDAVVKCVNRRPGKGAVFVLWGKPALAKCANIDRRKHKVIVSSHPSPLSNTKTDAPFTGSKCCSRINAHLVDDLGCESGVDWDL
ncbi:hypothetical protein JL721_5119 [Aureococcus anophagefferens]|nr:hypothetical protein JL721_5119 [Aureococcus anophagefferens]